MSNVEIIGIGEVARRQLVAAIKEGLGNSGLVPRQLTQTAADFTGGLEVAHLLPSAVEQIVEAFKIVFVDVAKERMAADLFASARDVEEHGEPFLEAKPCIVCRGRDGGCSACKYTGKVSVLAIKTPDDAWLIDPRVDNRRHFDDISVVKIEPEGPVLDREVAAIPKWMGRIETVLFNEHLLRTNRQPEPASCDCEVCAVMRTLQILEGHLKCLFPDGKATTPDLERDLLKAIAEAEDELWPDRMATQDQEYAAARRKYFGTSGSLVNAGVDKLVAYRRYLEGLKVAGEAEDKVAAAIVDDAKKSPTYVFTPGCRFEPAYDDDGHLTEISIVGPLAHRRIVMATGVDTGVVPTNWLVESIRDEMVLAGIIDKKEKGAPDVV